MTTTRVYISGPMTGIKDFNYPAFHAAERALRARGFAVENPANNPDPDPKTWENFMRMSVKQICECSTVVTLPGWTGSRGAKFEVLLAETLGLDVYPLERLIGGSFAAQDPPRDLPQDEAAHA